MALTNIIDGENYDVFYGRILNEEGLENYGSHDLPDGGGIAIEPGLYAYLELAKRMLADIENGKRVLLHKSPGFIGNNDNFICYLPFNKEPQNFLKELAEAIRAGKNGLSERLSRD